jgi:hypothetical protein
MYRACSTWQYEVVGHLMEQNLRGERLGYVSGESYATMTAAADPRRVLSPRRGWRVLKSHEGHRSFARALGSGQALAVYTYRDLREVVLSLRHKRATSFEALLRQGMIHQILANDRFWRAQPRVLVQRYEELIADPATAVVQLARHLGLGVTRREGAQIADEYSLRANQSRIDALRQRLLAAGIDLDDPENQQICDPVTLLHWNHLRPARSGSWQSEATPRERRLLARLCNSWLAANGYALEEMHCAALGAAGSSVSAAIQAEIDLALGLCAAMLRSAAASTPRSALWIKRLLRLPPELPQRLLTWPLTEEARDASPGMRQSVLEPEGIHFALDHLLRG